MSQPVKNASHKAGFGLLLSILLLGCFISFFYVLLTGFPPEFFGKTFKLKNFKPLVSFSVLLIILRAAIIAEKPLDGIRRLRDRLFNLAASPQAIWVLIASYAILFSWQQLAEYLSLKINFLPFSFYDYMLLNLLEGKIFFTGLLHRFYHANFILYALAPLWMLFKDPLFLIVIYGPLATLAAIPLYEIAKIKLDRPLAFFTVLVYLNYRYLQNVLQMNFSIEIFYPLFLFMALAAALRGKWAQYYLAVILGLLVKEDSFIYFVGLSTLVLFMSFPKEHAAGRVHAVASGLLSLGFYLFLSRVVLPFFGSDIMSANMNNFTRNPLGEDLSDFSVMLDLLKNPLRLASVFFGHPEKLETYWALFSRLLFIPLFSPAVFFVLFPIFPLFLHDTGRDTDFIRLHFHYAAAVIPFVFIAFIFGFSNLLKKIPTLIKSRVISGLILGLVLLNVGYYRADRISSENLESIAWAKSVPQGANLVTHGHLLPYVGYRQFNYYFADPFELLDHPAHKAYASADYYLIDKSVNLYPMSWEYFEGKLTWLRNNPDYELLRSDTNRSLFKKKTAG